MSVLPAAGTVFGKNPSSCVGLCVCDVRLTWLMLPLLALVCLLPLLCPNCSIGQNLAKLELQVVLATLLSRFTFSPGPELHRELQLAAATGQPALMAVHALAGCYVTLQPLSGAMRLRVTARRSQAEGVETEE